MVVLEAVQEEMAVEDMVVRVAAVAAHTPIAQLELNTIPTTMAVVEHVTIPIGKRILVVLPALTVPMVTLVTLKFSPAVTATVVPLNSLLNTQPVL